MDFHYIIIQVYKLENIRSNTTQLIVIIRIKVYFTLLLLAKCFDSFFRSHLQAEVLCIYEGEIYS